MLRIDILTLFPEMFPGPFGSSIIKRALEQSLATIKLHNLRDYTHDAHRTVDDSPYGGGAGMVLKPEPVFEAVAAIKSNIEKQETSPETSVILLTPQGRLFRQEIARELAGHRNLILISGHYEGIDERVRYLADDEISIGDYVLSGGELPAMVLVDAVVRLLPDVLGSPSSLLEESHNAGLLEYPQYTRPPEYQGWKVPEVLLSGNHQEIARWRRKQAIERTLERRPELLAKASLSPKEREMFNGQVLI
ncbi:MAG: tRNA (guanosine(37)-N1)-methyltransferase TrmD [Chloroflexota bacterium]